MTYPNSGANFNPLLCPAPRPKLWTFGDALDHCKETMIWIIHTISWQIWCYDYSPSIFLGPGFMGNLVVKGYFDFQRRPNRPTGGSLWCRQCQQRHQHLQWSVEGSSGYLDSTYIFCWLLLAALFPTLSIQVCEGKIVKEMVLFLWLVPLQWTNSIGYFRYDLEPMCNNLAKKTSNSHLFFLCNPCWIQTFLCKC